MMCIIFELHLSYSMRSGAERNMSKVETPIHDSIRELITWECKEHGVKS